MAVPIVTRKPWGIICLLMNIFIPGTGSMIAGGNQEDVKTFVFGVVQMLTALLLIGYLWSLVWGILIFVRSEPPVDVKVPASASG